MRRRLGFTLIELLTVIAITVVLLGIITIPLIQSLNITRAAQGYADAQNRARILIEQMTREIGNASFVRDNTGLKGAVTIEVPRAANLPGQFVRMQLENARLDIIAPAQGDPTTAPGGGLINPDTGKVDPTLRTPRGDVNLPVSQGFRLIRYFVGLKSPFQTDPSGNPLPVGNVNLPGRYNNPYDGVLNRQSGLADNLYVLYRAEINLREYDGATNTWRINRELFDLDNSGAATPQELEAALDDPNFFVFSTVQANWTQDLRRIQAWQRRSRVVTEFSRYDMIQVVIDRRTRAIQTYLDPTDNVLKPRVVSLVSFTPRRVSNEPMAGMEAVRSGEETENASKIGPDVFMADFGNVSSPFVRLRPSSYRDGANNIVQPWLPYEPWLSTRPYLVGRNRVVGGVIQGYSQYNFSVGSDTTDGIEIFDQTAYLEARDYDRSVPLPAGATNLFRYPFSWAIEVAAAREAGTNVYNSAPLREDFIPFALDRKAGKIIASFGITEVGSNVALPVGVDDNRPVAGTGDALPPGQDPLVTGGAPTNQRWAAAEFNPALSSSRVNQRFNVLWNDWDLLAPQFERAQVLRRFIDLRVTPQVDGTPSPLDPRIGLARARIVPGSEQVIGPDQTPGTNYGQPVRYTRVPTPGNVGPNQYYINYVNQPEPTWAQYGLTVDPNIYDPTYYDDASANWENRLISQILQPRYRAGYLELNSLPGEPLPAGNISVFYRFQFTEPRDVVEIDYDSRQLIDISLTIRNFPQTTLPNQQNVSVKGQASVRNLLR